MWLTAALYGVPTALFGEPILIEIGRTVTALLSLALLYLLFKFVRKLGTSVTISLFCTLLLAASASFFYSSHSARYDILTSLATCTILFVLIDQELKPANKYIFFGLGVLACAGILVSIHVPLLTCGIFLYFLFSRKGSSLSNLLPFLLGIITTAALIILIQVLIYTDFHLFGSTASNTFSSNVNDIPLLRPFSRSVQLANLEQKWKHLRESAFTLTLTGIIASIALPFIWKKLSEIQRRVIIYSLLVLISWVLLESAAPPSYVIYVAPIIAIIIGVTLEVLLKSSKRVSSEFALTVLSLVLAGFSVVNMTQASSIGKEINSKQRGSLEQGVQTIKRDPLRDTSAKVLGFNPTIHFLLQDKALHVITTHFIEFPAEKKSISEVLRENKVGYLIGYQSSLRPDYMREVNPLLTEARERGTLLYSEVGKFTDIGRSYTSNSAQGEDTLFVYRFSY